MSQNTAASYGAIEHASAGDKYDLRPDTVSSRAAEAITAFGLAVTYGTDPEKQVTIVNSAADVFLGVALKTLTSITAAGATPGYEIADTVSTLEAGAVWVEVTADVVSGEAAYVDIANGKLTNVSTSNLAVPGGRFETSALTGALAVLKF